MGNNNNCQAFCESLVAETPRDRLRQNANSKV